MFEGFDPLASNVTYTPNQYFDVVVPNYSRGVVRLVGYMIRRTLGWCDKEGNPQEAKIEISYSEICKKAGISRSAVKRAILEAVHGKFIQRVQRGIPDRKECPRQSGIYELRWSSSHLYKKTVESFDGFFGENGNRTYVPNQFFDIIVPKESLSTIKIVAAVTRLSIGFQAKKGIRRRESRVSLSHFRRYLNIKTTTIVVAAIDTAVKKNYITKISTKKKTTHSTNVYSLYWKNERIKKYTTPPTERGKKLSTPPPYRAKKYTTLPGQKVHYLRNETKEILSHPPECDDNRFVFGECEKTKHHEKILQLAKALEKQGKFCGKLKHSVWSKQFDLLETEDGFHSDRITNVLDWYVRNIAKEFVPKAFSATSFRKKFLQIEDSMQRSGGFGSPIEITSSALFVFDRISCKSLPETELKFAVQKGLNNYKDFFRKLRNLDTDKLSAHEKRLVPVISQSAPSPATYVERFINSVLSWMITPTFSSLIFSPEKDGFQKFLKMVAVEYSGHCNGVAGILDAIKTQNAIIGENESP